MALVIHLTFRLRTLLPSVGVLLTWKALDQAPDQAPKASLVQPDRQHSKGAGGSKGAERPLS